MNAEILALRRTAAQTDSEAENRAFLSRELELYGIHVICHSVVGSDPENLDKALLMALGRCDMVILTGDGTDGAKEAIARRLGVPLVPHTQMEQDIREYCRSNGREYTAEDARQSLLPDGCTVFANDHGCMPGFAVQRYGQQLLSLPAASRDLVPMVTGEASAYLAALSEGAVSTHTVGLFGMTEATLTERLGGLLIAKNPTVVPYARDGEILLRVTARAATQADAEAMCEPVLDDIRQRMGAAVYGVDVGSLQKRVVDLLKQKNKKIATAESCTAGMLSERLTEVPGVSQVFECGIAAYSKDIKHQVLGVSEEVLRDKGAVSSETAAAMAAGARRVGGADIGVGITGVAGPASSEHKSVGTVYVALADERRVWVKKIFAGEGGSTDREYIRYVSTSHALDMTRRYLEALPGVMAGGQPAEEIVGVTEAGNSPVKPHTPRTRRTMWITALLALLVIAVFLTYAYILTPYLNQKKYDDLWVMYTQGQQTDTSATTYPDGILTPFMSLYRVNKDVRGWVNIPGTGINYPVVQEPSEGYYANRNFYGKVSAFGTPYLTGQAKLKAGIANRALVVYGNNSGNGQMFSDLGNYTELTYLRKYPLVEMDTLYNTAKYKIFAVMIVGTDERYTDNFDFTVDSFESEEDFLYYVAQIRRRSLFDTAVRVEENDNLLLLTTPVEYGFDNSRIVIVARQVRTGEDEENDLSNAYANRHVLMPLAWQIKQGDITAATVTGGTTVGTTEEQPTEPSVTASQTATATSSLKATTVKTNSKPTTGTEATSADTESTTAKPTTAKPTTVPNPGGTTQADGLVSGTIAESKYLEKFAIRNTNSAVKLTGQDASGVVTAKNKQELQYALSCVVKTELGSASTMVSSTEAQKAQAVASYSYILWYNFYYNAPYPISAKAIDQNNRYDKMIYDAVGTVAGVKLAYTGKTNPKESLVQASYSAATGGNSATCRMVWGGSIPYLVSVSSPYDNELTYAKYAATGNFCGKLTLSRDALYEKIRAWFAENIKTDHPGYTLPENQFTTDDGKLPLTVRSYDGNGTSGQGDSWNYVYLTDFYYVTDKGTTVYLTGHTLRNILGLQSHAFRVSYDAATHMVTIRTQGHGHGVGLSQMGAVGYANEEGWTYVKILKHYYSVTGSSAWQVAAPQWN